MTRQSARLRFAAVVKKAGGLAPVADRLRVTMSYVSMIKNGKRDPGRAVATRIERCYGIPVKEWELAA